MTIAELFREIAGLLPELILSIAIVAVIFLDILSFKRCILPVALIATMLAIVPLTPQVSNYFFYSTFTGDGLSLFFRGFFLVGTAFVILLSARTKELAGYRMGEFYALLLGATLGACLLVGAMNFVLFVVALETLSLCSYVLSGYIKHERQPAEASLKYLLFGAVASATLLFGVSFLYGLSGTLDIGSAMQTALHPARESAVFATVLALVLVFSGLAFKIAAVPFQFWCPDVYQGAPTVVTAYLSVVSKAAGLGALLRLLHSVLDAPPITLCILFGVLAAVTMTFGNLIAVRQTDAKRLLAYSSIAHAGYLLLGFAVFSREAREAVLAYLAVYLFMNLAAFWAITLLVRERNSSEIAAYRGVAHRAPLLFTVLFLALIALTGLPPTAGFVAKFLLFKAVIVAALADPGPLGTFYLALAVIGVLNSVVSLYYYMKLARVMVFEEDEQPVALDDLDCAQGIVLALPLILFLNFGWLLELVNAGAR